MLSTIGVAIFLASGVPPEEMATIVAARLTRLDQIVADVEVQTYMCPQSAQPLDATAWSAPLEPGDGGRRLMRIVRPSMMEESFVTSRPESIVTSFTPGRSVRRVGTSQHTGRVVYSIDETPISSGSYTLNVPLLQLLDLQVHESHVPGLNVLSLLRDYPSQLVASDGETSTYAVTLESQNEPPGDWMEQYEFDVDTCGTPTRFRTVIETSAGFHYQREFLVRATQELNGAEFVTEAVSYATNSAVENYEIDHFVVCSAEVDPALSPEDVLFEPERRNAVVWTTQWPIDTANPVRYEEYDESGQLATSGQSAHRRVAWGQAILPAAVACGFIGALCVAFVSSARYGRPRATG